MRWGHRGEGRGWWCQSRGDAPGAGGGEEMARAIEGLGLGNVPGMQVYKRAVVWGDRVKAFLRREGEV